LSEKHGSGKRARRGVLGPLKKKPVGRLAIKEGPKGGGAKGGKERGKSGEIKGSKTEKPPCEGRRKK